MTEEERTAHDAAARKREAEEQAGTPLHLYDKKYTLERPFVRTQCLQSSYPCLPKWISHP